MTGYTQNNILHLIKTRGDLTAQAIAGHMDITVPATRKHLKTLEDANLVTFRDESGKVGRPSRHWHLTAEAHARFPDTHDTLTLELIDAVRTTFGETGLDKLISERERQSLAHYRAECANLTSLPDLIAKLAQMRTQEGYMAEVTRLDDDIWILAENHCPICAAASQCQNFCRSELQIFQAVLAGKACLQREEHIVSGARRCAYRITATDRPAP